MSRKTQITPKEHYQRLRVLSCDQLWSEEIPAFDRASAPARISNVAVIRAVGVVFSESGTEEQKERARAWLLTLLRDPEEKIRRYAITALPKLGADVREEAELLTLLEKPSSDRERQFLGRALEKIGGAATLEATTGGGLDRTAQKAAANLARLRTPGGVRFDAPLPAGGDIHIHLHCRRGLERILEDELHEHTQADPKFQLVRSEPGLVAVAPRGAFTLGDIYALRCFSAASFVLGTAKAKSSGGIPIEELATVIASPAARRVLESFTEGPIRYRLEFISKGHQRSAVRELGNRVYALCPALLNDSRSAPWQIDIHEIAQGFLVELSPRLRPDPRFDYRKGDVPAASHPPLAACMARLAGKMDDEILWDPFCGSGLELIERALRGGVSRIVGTDRSPEAIVTARENLIAAGIDASLATFMACDFRDHATIAGLDAVSLVITNPPMGRRVPIPNLRGLIEDLFTAAAAVLKPGGRLVFANPLPVKPAGDSLELEFRRKVDLGGFNVHLEKYVKRA